MNRPGPPNLKMFEGDRAKQRMSTHGRTASRVTENLTPPSWLSPEGKRYWKQTAPLLAGAHVLSDSNQYAFAATCEAWSLYNEAIDGIRREGHIVQSKRSRAPRWITNFSTQLGPSYWSDDGSSV